MDLSKKSRKALKIGSRKGKEGHQDDSVSKGACCQAWQLWKGENWFLQFLQLDCGL